MKNSDAARTADAKAEVQRYRREHPGSPSARRRPIIVFRGHSVVALLRKRFGDEAIGGVGNTISAAFEAFDAQYRTAMDSRRKARGSIRPGS